MSPEDEARRTVLQATAERATALADFLDSRYPGAVFSTRTGERVDRVGQLRRIAAEAEIDLAFLPEP